jgi:amidophosphoribosyltransferase
MIREACAVFGVFAPGEDVANLAYFALFALQHRGQESSGMAVSDGSQIQVHKGMGLVAQVFNEDILNRLRGVIAVGHNRYSTTGRSNLQNAQPLLVKTHFGPAAFAHNGNLVNYTALRQTLENKGVVFQTTSDSEIIAQLFALAKGQTLEEKLKNALAPLVGAYSVVFSTCNTLVGFRDPFGIRPLCLGKIGKLSSGWVISSESCALHTVGADFVREIEPGEAILVNENGVQSFRFAPSFRKAFCIFEHIYFMRPDSLFAGKHIYSVRFQMGRLLARQAPIDADGVMPIPDSSVPAAIGYSFESRIPFFEGLIKNRYIARTFIQPEERLRRMGIRLKFHALQEHLEGKKVIVVDDSIVRGNTTKAIVALLKESGAKEVHLRITSPPIRHPCNLGIDMATYEELIAHNKSVEEIRAYLGADSLHYLSLENLLSAVSFENGKNPLSDAFCAACLTGDYPIQSESPKHAIIHE